MLPGRPGFAQQLDVGPSQCVDRRRQVAHLHAFAIPGLRGKYWFTNGVNPRACVAWACGAGLGLLLSTNSLFTGPLESSVNGADISWLVAGSRAA